MTSDSVEEISKEIPVEIVTKKRGRKSQDKSDVVKVPKEKKIREKKPKEIKVKVKKEPVILGQRKRDLVCGYCGLAFSKERTLMNHMCVKKQRYNDKDRPYFRTSFRAFQMFYSITTRSKNEKTVEEFISSSLYISFVKFGEYLNQLRPLYPEMFIEYVIRNTIPIQNWTTQAVLDAYIVHMLSKEPSMSAVERTIVEFEEWAKDNNTSMSDFYSSVLLTEFVYLLNTGKISPWVLYLSDNADVLWNRLDNQTFGLIKNVADPQVWNAIISKDKDAAKIIRDVLKEVNL